MYKQCAQVHPSCLCDRSTEYGFLCEYNRLWLYACYLFATELLRLACVGAWKVSVCVCVCMCGRRGSAGLPLVRVPPGICPSSWMTRWSPRLWSTWPESSHQRGAVGRNSNLYLLWTLTLSGCFFPNRRTPRTLQSQQLLPTSTPASSATPLGRCSSSTGVKEGEVGVVARFYGSFYGPKRPFSKHLLPAHQWDVRSLTSDRWRQLARGPPSFTSHHRRSENKHSTSLLVFIFK